MSANAGSPSLDPVQQGGERRDLFLAPDEHRADHARAHRLQAATSGLFAGTPPGAPAAHRAVLHLRAVARAPGALMPERDDLAGVGAAVQRRRTSGPTAAPGTDGRRPRAGGCSTGAAGEIRACQSVSSASRFPTPAILDWSSSRALTAIVPLPSTRRNSSGRDLLRVRAERADVGVQPDAPQPPRVEQGQPAAVGELDREPVPLRLARPRAEASSQPGAARRPRLAFPPPGAVTTMLPLMPRWIPRSGPGVGVPVQPGGLDPDGFAPPPGGREPASDQRVTQLPGRCAAGSRRCPSRPLATIRPVQCLIGDQAAGGLDLGKLRHPPVLPDQGPAAVTRPGDRAAGHGGEG